MREVKTTRVLPRWFRSGDPEDLVVADMPEVGYTPDLPPRIATRVIPKDGSNGLSFDSISDIVQSIQHAVVSVAHELAYGVDKMFSDMRKIEKGLIQFARIHSEPLEPGSFVIPAELDDTEAEFDGKTITTRQIVERFEEVMVGLGQNGAAIETNLAVLQAIVDLDKVLKRDVDRIELTPNASPTKAADGRRIIVDSFYVSEVSYARKKRLHKRVEFLSVTGTLRAVDTTQFKLKIELSDSRIIIPGEYAEALQPRMILFLGKPVKITGDVTYLHGFARHIKVFHVDEVS